MYHACIDIEHNSSAAVVLEKCVRTAAVKQKLMMMSRHNCTLLLLTFLSCVLLETIAISTQDFFGERIPTQTLVPNDDDSSEKITLSVPYPFFDKPMTQLYVSPDLRKY